MLNKRPLDGVGIPVFWFPKQQTTPFEKNKQKIHPTFSLRQMAFTSFQRTSVSIRFSLFYFFFFSILLVKSLVHSSQDVYAVLAS
jgi:hypothetical protein